MIARFFGIDSDPTAVADLVDDLAPPERSSDFLHAMLDFAAGVCTPRDPDCRDCPLESDCDRYGVGTDD